jgi:Flp pilus assembly protein TadG
MRTHFSLRAGSTKHERGQSLVEMALALPILLLLLVGATDVGRAFYTYVAITNAAREGARYGASNPSSTFQIQARVQNEVKNSQISIPSGNITVSCSKYTAGSYTQGSSVNCSSASSGDYVTVRVTYNFNFITGFIFRVGSITMSNSATMAIH